MRRITEYFLNRADNVTAWIGVIGLILLALHLGSFLFILFIVMIILPETSFSNLFGGWTKELRDIDQKSKTKK